MGKVILAVVVLLILLWLVSRMAPHLFRRR